MECCPRPSPGISTSKSLDSFYWRRVFRGQGLRAASALTLSCQLPPPEREQQRVCTESRVHSHCALCILKHHQFPLVPQIKTQYPRVHSSLPALQICNFSNTEKAGSYYLQSTYLFDSSRHESTFRVTNPQPCEKQTY